MAQRDSAHRDPEEIQREIELTRAELAETIDAIADKVSPKRAVARTTERIKERFGGGTHAHVEVGIPETGERLDLTAVDLSGRPGAPYAGRPELGATAMDKHELNVTATGVPGGAAGGRVYEVRRRLRVDRVVLVAGAAAGLVAVIVLLRRRRHR